jgi:hypothetical protein
MQPVTPQRADQVNLLLLLLLLLLLRALMGAGNVRTYPGGALHEDFNRTKGQQVPKHPMQPRQGSRAGGFRPGVGGSGQTDTRVASSHPSKT